MEQFTCPMHPEVQEAKPGGCPKCGMTLVPTKMKHGATDHTKHETHVAKPVSEMPAGRSLATRDEGWSFWEKLKMSMTMTMGMDHTGLAGQEMAKLMEEDIRNKFFFALLLTIPILAYSMGRTMFSWNLPSPLPIPWLLFILTHQYSFIVVGYSSIHPILSLRRCASACQFSLLLVLLLRMASVSF